MATVLDLRWEDPATVWYVLGHVADEEALAAVREHLQDEVDSEDRESVPRLNVTGHTYGRWEDDEMEEGSKLWDTCDESSDGAVAVTEVIDADDRDSTELWKGNVNAKADELEAFIRARLPEATKIEARRWPVLDRKVEFRLPGLVGTVEYDAEDRGHVYVSRDDVEAWKRYHGRLS